MGVCSHDGKHRPDGTLTPAVRKIRVDDNQRLARRVEKSGDRGFPVSTTQLWASWLIQSGVPLSVLQEMGGWESIEMVRHYAHLAPNHLTEHARKIDAIFGASDTNTTQKEEIRLVKNWRSACFLMARPTDSDTAFRLEGPFALSS